MHRALAGGAAQLIGLLREEESWAGRTLEISDPACALTADTVIRSVHHGASPATARSAGSRWRVLPQRLALLQELIQHPHPGGAKRLGGFFAQVPDHHIQVPQWPEAPA